MPNENIRIMCPSLVCRKILAVPISSRGKNVRCRNCGATIRVPETPPAVVKAAPDPDKGDGNKAGAKPGAAAKAA